MEVEYTLTRAEILQGFLRGLITSPRFFLTVLLQALAVGIFAAFVRGAFTRSFHLRDGWTVLAWAAGMFVFMPVWLYFRGKTYRRTLRLNPEGMETRIGSMHAQIPWNKVMLVKDTDRFVLIARTGGNAFLIPNRAFSSPEQRAKFLAELRERSQPSQQQERPET